MNSSGEPNKVSSAADCEKAVSYSKECSPQRNCMNSDVLRAAVKGLHGSEQGSGTYTTASFALYHALSGAHREALSQLVKQGPVYDGDVISKSLRDDLMQLGLASRVCYKGEQGYTAANYAGWDVLRSVER
jgi:hypothetical protein